MQSFDFFENRKGQAAETMTWVVATLIIVFLIVSSIYVASLLGKNKEVKLEKISGSEENEWVMSKTNFALQINDDNRELILEWVSESSIEKNSGGIFSSINGGGQNE